jgi:hypothetical protein
MQSYTILAIEKCKNIAKIVFGSNTRLLLLLNNYLTTTVVFIMFTDQVVDHRRVEPLLKLANFINGALTAKTERANNHPP